MISFILAVIAAIAIIYFLREKLGIKNWRILRWFGKHTFKIVD